jgi:hypothetical protein
MARQTRFLGDLPYEPLMNNPPEIRLIQLRPRTYKPPPPASSDILVCELIRAVRGCCPPYMALSYVWGKNIDLVPLRIGGRQYHVNATVEAALRQLQAEDSGRFCVGRSNLHQSTG